MKLKIRKENDLDQKVDMPAVYFNLLNVRNTENTGE